MTGRKNPDRSFLHVASGPRRALHSVMPSGLLVGSHSDSSGVFTREFVWKYSLSCASRFVVPQERESEGRLWKVSSCYVVAPRLGTSFEGRVWTCPGRSSDSPSPGRPQSAKRSSLVGKQTRGGLGKPLARERRISALNTLRAALLALYWRYDSMPPNKTC